MINRKRLFLRILIVVLFLFSVSSSRNAAYGFRETVNLDYERAKLLGFILKQNLELYHFSNKRLDDSISKNAFSLYLKNLDLRKRFLLKDDVRKLEAYAELIDNEINSGKLDLPGMAEQILSERVRQVSLITKEILSHDFDFSDVEYIESDVSKLDYCATLDELKDRWRQTLKFQVLDRYLNEIEEQAASVDSGEKDDNNLQRTIREKILKHYDLLFSRMLDQPKREDFDLFFASVTQAFDPHTAYMPPVNVEDFDILLKGSLEGIGATLKEEDGLTKVVSIVPGGPAYHQGELMPEDIILEVGQGSDKPVNISDMKLRDSIRLIRGKKGTEVRLTIRKPDGSKRIIKIVRNIVELKSTFAKGAVIEESSSKRKFGYIKIPKFYRDFEKTRNGDDGRNVTDDVRAELEKLKSQGIEGLILDLRNNSGGALTDAVKMTGLFIDSGPVVQVKGNRGEITELSDDDPGLIYPQPLVVLVNKFSASASEILAGALQDYRRAVIVGGDHTHGKGTVQTIIDLDKGILSHTADTFKPIGALKLTTQKFYRISGESTQYRGIIPDIVLPDTLETLKSGEQYNDFALPWDTIEPVSYTPLQGNIPVAIPELRDKSTKRILSKNFFIEIIEANKKAADQQKSTLEPLNLDEARKKREEDIRLHKAKNHTLSEDDDPDKESKNSRLTEEQLKEQWIKEIIDDAYIQEAASILNDMVPIEHNLTLK